MSCPCHPSQTMQAKERDNACSHAQKKQAAMLWTAVICLIAFTAASCTSSEISSEPPRPATMMMAQAANPCAATNPCAMQATNPCNPCAAKNPCAAAAPIDPALIARPAGPTLFAGTQDQLIQEGERLWNDQSLGTSGLACQTCHLNHGNFNPSFAKPYPHSVAMTQQRAGVQQVDLDEMVQFCMVVPMAGQPLPWGSKELAALTAYSRQVQKEFIQAAAVNPCMLKPAAANPCNPCAARNPCAAKNPCAMKPVNPCAAKNPCATKNPCAAR